MQVQQSVDGFMGYRQGSRVENERAAELSTCIRQTRTCVLYSLFCPALSLANAFPPTPVQLGLPYQH